ncbi:MAG: cysteine synthase A [Phycisphaerales bacterium]|nr:cysteine synthase A [Phycisphaerales bacterium]
MAGIYSDITKTMGNTPLVRINHIVPAGGATVLAKCEFFNPLGSVKDRIGVSMIEAGEQAGKIDKNTHILEATSGNTGIALAYVCAAKGYRLTLTMPETMSIERRRLLRILGANLVLTPGSEGMPGAIRRCNEMHQAEPNSVIASQFDNPANPSIHMTTTAEEIWRDTGGKVDAAVSAVGTGGTLTGVATVLKKRNPHFKAIAVEPTTSPVITQFRNGEPMKPGPHKIQGAGAGFIPRNLNVDLVDDVIKVTDEDAFAYARRLAAEEGILAGISSGANMWAALQVAMRPEYQGKTIVTFMCSTGERYISTPMYEGLEQ